VAQLSSQRQYMPNSTTLQHQCLHERLKGLRKKWKRCYQSVKDELEDSGDYHKIRPYFEQLEVLKTQTRGLNEKLQDVAEELMVERGAVYSDLEKLKILFSRTRDECASRKKVIDTIRSYCDDMGKDDMEPKTRPAQTGTANNSVKQVLEVIRSYCDDMVKGDTEPKANSGQTGAAEPFSPMSKYTLDSVEKDFGITLTMLEGERPTETRNNDDSKQTILYGFLIPSSAKLLMILTIQIAPKKLSLFKMAV
jgi:hypothetical protein